MQTIKSIQGKKPDGKFWYDWPKSILTTFNMTIISSDHVVLSWNYNTYTSIIAVDTDDVPMSTKNRISF